MRIVRWVAYAVILVALCANFVFADSVKYMDSTNEGYIKTRATGTNTDPLVVYQVTVGGTTNGDYACFYDGAVSDYSTKKPLIDVVVSANTTQTIYFPRGVQFDTDVDVDVGTTTTTVITMYTR